MKCPKSHFDNPDTQRFCGECGTQLIPVKEVSVSHAETLEIPKNESTAGTTFAGRYQIISELDEIARKTLGVGIEEIKSALKK